MKVIVTGAAGFVGKHLVPALIEDGHQVIAMVRPGSEAPKGAETVECDLAEIGVTSLPDADAIVNLAQANVQFPEHATELFAVNTVSTQRLLDHAVRTGAVRFIHASSASVYGTGPTPHAEPAIPAASDFYALTKISAERLVGAYAPFVGTTILRLEVPYGPGQRNRLVPTLVDRVRNGQPVHLNRDASPRVNPVYVGDVVRVVLRALPSDGHQLVNVGGDEAVSVRDLAMRIGAVTAQTPVFEETDRQAGDLLVDTQRLHDVFPGLRPLVALDEGLRRTVKADA